MAECETWTKACTPCKQAVHSHLDFLLMVHNLIVNSIKIAKGNISGRMSTAVRTAFLSFLVPTIHLVIRVICKWQHPFIFFPTVPVHCCHNIVQTPSPQHSYSDASPRLSLSSDNASSASDFDSEPDQVSTHFEQPPRKKRQRTTFSLIEVWELERAYRRQPYLTREDEEDLVQRLGITAKSLKVRFSRITNGLKST